MESEGRLTLDGDESKAEAVLVFFFFFFSRIVDEGRQGFCGGSSSSHASKEGHEQCAWEASRLVGDEDKTNKREAGNSAYSYL